MHKIVVNGYVVSVSNSKVGIEICEEEYSRIIEAIANKPKKDGFYYKLKDDTLTWEEFEMLITPEEEAEKLIGGDTNE